MARLSVVINGEKNTLPLTDKRLRIKEEQLSDGDVLQVGPFEFHYEDRAAQSVVLDDNKYFPLAAEAREVKSGELPELALDLKEFYRISKRLNAILNLREL